MRSPGTDPLKRAVLGPGATLLGLALVAFVPANAVDLVLGPAELEHALTIGRSSDAERARFHAPYLVALTDPTVQQLEVLSEFRRVVRAAEDHIRRGYHMFSARQAREAVLPWRGTLTIVLRLRFHPQNVFVGVPSYEVTVGEPAAIRTLDVRRTPVHAGPGSKSRPGATIPLIGGLVESDFDASEIGQRVRVIRVILEGQEVARTTIDFGRIE